MAVTEAAVEAAQHGGAHGADIGPVVVLLAAAVIAVPIFRKAGLGSVLGYLAAGLAIGPFGLGFFHDPEGIIGVAELGVVLFLFIIGLEMQPSRLWAMRGEIFGLGFLQVALAIAVLTCVGLVLGFPVAASFVSGTGFVLTSTAIVMQMLAERNQMALPKGRRIISILLLEDLAIVPLLAAVAFLAPGGEAVTMSQRLTGIGIGLGAIGALVLAGRYLLNPMFGLLARFGGREVMTAAALLVVLGAALLMQWGGLSMAMGAFLAGVLLSESSFRHQLEADVEPFRGLLLGLFFLGVGMALDLDVIAQNWALIAICVPAYMILKMAVIYVIARAMRADKPEAMERAVLMAQGGEFAFVLYSSAMQFGIISAQENATLTAIVIVSMVLTPLMIILHDRLAPKPAPSMDGVEAADGLHARVLMIGFGRMGQIVSQPLIARGHSISIIENDPQTIRDADQAGFKIPWAVDRDRRSGRVGLLRHPSAQETAMNKPSPAIIPPATIRTDLGAIFISLELSRSRWIVTSLSPGGAEKMSKYSVPGGDLAGLMERFRLLVAKAKARSGQDFPIVTIQEAGLDGFWIHRALEKEGIESHVVDPASIATSRRRRRAKTDRIDGEALVRTLLAFKRGEPRVCAMVRAPSPMEEDARRIMRERKTLTGERVAHVNRIKGLLFAQGVSGYEPLRRDRRKRLEELRTGDGRELPRHLTAQILRELDRLELLLAQIKAVEVERDVELAQAREAALPASAARLLEIRGIGPEFATLLWSEGLYRHFDNRRQVAAYAGLAPTPWQSGTVDQEQGVSKAGNPRLRTTMIQLAWLWLQHQPTSALTQWFRYRVAHHGGRSRKPAIVALARKLLVALWKYVATGVVIEGAAMKPA